MYKETIIGKWTQGCILSLSKKDYLKISKKYRGSALPAVAAKIYYPLFFNNIQPEVEKILRKNQNNNFSNNSSEWFFLQPHRFRQSVESSGVLDKKFVDSILNTEKRWSKYKCTKTTVHSPDSDTNFFDIVTGEVQRDKLAPYCLYTDKTTYFKRQ